MSDYSEISECGQYGLKPHGGNATGGELWAWINSEFPTKVGELMDCDNFLIAPEKGRCLQGGNPGVAGIGLLRSLVMMEFTTATFKASRTNGALSAKKN